MTDEAPEARSTMGTVLVVDDEKNILRSLRMILSGEGFEVATASSGESALDRIRSGLFPDVILLDLKLPGVDGIETLRRIRDPELLGSAVPVISVVGGKWTTAGTCSSCSHIIGIHIRSGIKR